MTRDEYFRKLREEFIDRHLTLPGWMEQLPPWLREYFRILYWVFFKPSALRLHLHRIAREAGLEEPRGWPFLVLPATRRLLLQALFLTAAFLFLVRRLAGGALAAMELPFGWVMVLALLMVMVSDEAAGVAWGVAFGVAWGVAFGVAAGVATGVAAGVALGVAGGVALGVAWGVAWDVAGGVALGVAWGVAFGVAGGVATGVAAGVALGVAFFAGALIGVTRFPFWLGEMLLSRSPIPWDELPVLPQPRLAHYLAEKMRQSPTEGARWLSFVARHPYARWAISHAFSPPLATGLLLCLLRDPLPYVEPSPLETTDVRRREADPYFSTKLVLAELGGIRAIPGISNALASLLTSPLRRSLPAPYPRFFRAWYRLLEAAAPTDPRRFVPARLMEALEEAAEASAAVGSGELSDLLFALLSLSRKEDIGPIPLPSGAPLPEVLRGLRILNEEVVRAWDAYHAASGELARRDHLNEALSALDRVRQMAAESPEVPQPFAAVLDWIAERWYGIVAGERDRLLAARPIAPLEDFYVVGPPLTPESGRLFVGREEIFRRLEELFRNPLQKVPVVLYGQRRMGKTSILNHVGVRLGPHYIPVLADLQGLLSDPQYPIRSDRDLWQALMREIGRAVDVSPRSEESPVEFLDRLAPVRGERFIVLMLDEFEKLEQRMDEGAIRREFLEYLRHLMQHRRELLVILSGHHTLKERMGRYWEPLMGIARSVRVSYLEEDAARSLITDPWDGFRLQYTEASIQRLLMATGRQPMLLQLACSNVIREVNARMRREGYETYPTARPEEVERALDRLLEEGETWYFDAVWDWLTPHQRSAVVRLAQAYRPSSEGWIPWPEVAGITEEVIRSLEEREVLEVDGARCRFRVELLRRWLARRQPVR